MRGHTRRYDLIEGYCDAEAYRNHPLFSVCHHALQVLFYYDDVEVVNPIGSRTKIHKLGKLIILLNISFSYSIFLLHTRQHFSQVPFYLKCCS